MMWYSLIKERKSQIFICILIIFAIIMGLGAALLFHSRAAREIARMQGEAARAYSLARSGLDIGQRLVSEGATFPKSYNIGGGTLELVLADGKLTSTGTVGKSTRVLTKTFEPPDPLVAYWKFEGDANDETGKNDGELYAWLDLNGDGINEAGPSDLPVFVPGVQGQAIKLKRLVNTWNCYHNNGVKVPDSPSLDIKNQITLCAWLKHDDTDSYGIYGYGKIITKSYFNGFDDPWELYSLDITSKTKARFVFTDGITGGEFVGVPSTNTISEGVWYHFAGTYDGDIARFYINGELVAENDISPDFLIGVNNESVFIGGVENSPFHMYGLIDEVMIFNKALSQSEIKNIYDTQKSSHWTLVDDEVPDDDATYVWTGSTNYEKDSYELTDPISPSGTITNLRIVVRYIGKLQRGYRLNNTDLWYPITTSASGSYGDSDVSYLPSRPGGGSWTWDDINNLQVVVALSEYTSPGFPPYIPPTTYQGKITQIYVIVESTDGNKILRPNGKGYYNEIVNPPVF